MKKTTGYIVLPLLIILCICSMFVISSKEIYADIASGTYDNLSWRITDSGELILGNGSTQTMTNSTTRKYSSWPWQHLLSNVKTVRFDGTVIAQGSIREMFYQYSSGNTSITKIDVTGFDTTHVTNMRGVFAECRNLSEITGIENMRTDNTTVLHYMFNACTKLNNLDLSKWNTSNVTNTEMMFNQCESLTNLNIKGWNTSKVVDMSRMFAGCKSLVSLDLSGLNTSRVTNMNGVFYYATKLENLNISDWDVSNVTELCEVFHGCYRLNNLNINNWDVSKARTMRWLFTDCQSLTSLDLSNWHTPKLTEMTAMFGGCVRLTSLKVNHFNTSNVTSIYGDWGTGHYGLFHNCKNLEELDVSSFDCSRMTNMFDTFYGCKKLKKVIVGSKWSFRNNLTMSKRALLPTPSGEEYTGKWIREDESYGPFTPEELRDNYTSPMAGAWIWEERTPFMISFNAPLEASGSMPPVQMYTYRDNAIPKNEYIWFNHHFDHWDGDDGNIYTDEQIIPANTFSEEETLVLTAVFAKNDNSTTIENGEFELTLHTNEKASFTDFPGGSTYTIYEETPSGWQLINQVNPSGTIPANGSADAEFTNEYVPGNTTVQLIATKTLDGNTPSNNAYAFELLNSDNEVIETKSNDASGMILFSPITITAAGEKTYYIKEVRGEDPGINYDAHIETVTVHVTDDGAGNLTATPEYDTDGAKFENYTKPGMLTVTKETDGNGTGDESFTFEIKLTDEYNRSLDNIDIITPAA